jgi:two-component system response regulator AtoC
VPADVLQSLTEAPWPGNIRELQHCIERAVVTTKGSTLTRADIVGVELEESAPDLRSVSKCAMKQAERGRIVQALHESHGNRAQAAKNLKISRAGLYNKLREYGLT